jgi:hypothetical protein
VIPVMQTKKGGPDVPPEERGDCWPACLASILEVPITSIAVPHEEEDWWKATRDALKPHGFECFSSRGEVVLQYGYWIGTVPSLNLGTYEEDGSPVLHCVVMKGDRIAHDPSIGEHQYATGTHVDDIDLRECTVLVPLAIRSLAGRVAGEEGGA